MLAGRHPFGESSGWNAGGANQPPMLVISASEGASGFCFASLGVSGFQSFGPGKLGLGLGEGSVGLFPLLPQVVLRVSKIIATEACRLGKGRISEVVHIGDAAFLFFIRDLRIELGGHAIEFGNHHIELHDLPSLLIHLKLLQPNKILP